MRNNIIAPNSKTLFGSQNNTSFFDRKSGGGGIFSIIKKISYLFQPCLLFGRNS